MTATLAPSTESSCGDGLDEDLDDRPDCDDGDCAADPLCGAICPDLVAPGVPSTVVGSTLGRPDEETSTCGGAGAGDVAVEFTAPAAATYAFRLDPLATGFDATLTVRDGCGGVELGCDDTPTFGGELVFAPLAAGQTVVAVVDGWSADIEGTFALDVVEVAASETACGDAVDEDFDGATDCLDPDCAGAVECVATCPEDTLPGSPGQVVGDTTGLTDDTTPSCAIGSTGSDTTVEFTAPADGEYTFDTFGSSYDTTLYALDTCGGVELACDDDTDGLQSRISLDLLAGETVVLVVDAFSTGSGPFTLDVSGPVVPGVCPAFVLSNVLPASTGGSTVGAADDNAAPCGLAGGAPDHTYEFTAPTNALYTFDTVGSAYDTVLYALDTCGGVSLACNDDLGGGSVQSRIQLNLVAGQTIILVVDGYGANAGAYTLRAN